MKTRILIASALLAMSSCSDPMRNCVARGTRVRTPEGLRPIEELEVGDAIFCVDEASGQLVDTVVTDIRSAVREAGRLVLGQTDLVVTSDHPVYCPVERKYAPAGDWLLGRRSQLAVVTDAGIEPTVVDERQVFFEMVEVFDISVEHDLHNFVANGVLVHNKSVSTAVCDLDGIEFEDRDPCTCADGSRGAVDCTVPRCFCALMREDDVGTVDASDSGSDALFADCALDPSSPDPAESTCAQVDETESCVLVTDRCATGSCARLQGSEPFCTQECADAAECDGGTCVEFVFQTGVTHCAPP